MPNDTFPPHCASRFVPDRLLGEGGFGAVWLAHQIGLDRPVAIKFIRADVGADPESLERFKNEARVTASLQHPSIVRVIDHDVEDGVPWIAYEYLPGRSLSAVLAGGPLTWTEALRVGQQVASALEEAHSKGVIHRDIKPENVLEVEPGRYKLADFGIAKWTAATQIRTRTGFLMGTPTHVAPEQIRGDPPSPQGDVYALGVLMYQMLTGRLPFEDENMLGLLLAHLEERVTTPSRLQAGLPRAVDDLVKRALEKTPGKRFADGAALCRAIEEVSARPATMDEAARPAVDAPAGVPGGSRSGATQTGEGVQTSRTRLPRPSSRTRAIAAPASQVAPSGAGRPRRALVLGFAAASLAVVAIGFFAMRPAGPPPQAGSPSASAASVVARAAPSTSATAAPATGRFDPKLISLRLEPVLAGLIEFDTRERREAHPLSGSQTTVNARQVAPYLEKGLRDTLELVRDLQRAGFEGPAWAEMVAYQTEQLLQRVAHFSEPQRAGEIASLFAALDTVAVRRAVDPFRRAFGCLVHARYRHIQPHGAQDAIALFRSALSILATETPPEWAHSGAGLRVRLMVNYQLASAVERFHELGMLASLSGDVPRDVVAAWALCLGMTGEVEACYRGVQALDGRDAWDFWEVNWEILRAGERVLKIAGFAPAQRDAAMQGVAQAVARCGRIQLPIGPSKERDVRLLAFAQTMRDRGIQVRLPDGTSWPPPERK